MTEGSPAQDHCTSGTTNRTGLFQEMLRFLRRRAALLLRPVAGDRRSDAEAVLTSATGCGRAQGRCFRSRLFVRPDVGQPDCLLADPVARHQAERLRGPRRMAFRAPARPGGSRGDTRQQDRGRSGSAPGLGRICRHPHQLRLELSITVSTSSQTSVAFGPTDVNDRETTHSGWLRHAAAKARSSAVHSGWSSSQYRMTSYTRRPYTLPVRPRTWSIQWRKRGPARCLMVDVPVQRKVHPEHELRHVTQSPLRPEHSSAAAGGECGWRHSVPLCSDIIDADRAQGGRA